MPRPRRSRKAPRPYSPTPSTASDIPASASTSPIPAARGRGRHLRNSDLLPAGDLPPPISAPAGAASRGRGRQAALHIEVVPSVSGRQRSQTLAPAAPASRRQVIIDRARSQLRTAPPAPSLVHNSTGFAPTQEEQIQHLRSQALELQQTLAQTNETIGILTASVASLIAPQHAQSAAATASVASLMAPQRAQSAAAPQSITADVNPVSGFNEPFLLNNRPLTGNVVTRTRPVGHHLDLETKSLIREKKFIEFDRLLVNYKAAPDQFKWVQDVNGGMRAEKIKPKASRPLSFAEWCSAWNTYSAILCAHLGDPNLNASMCLHFQTVQSLYVEGSDWGGYDREFRLLIASPEVVCHWHDTDLILLIKAQKTPLIPQTTVFPPHNSFTTAYTQNSHMPENKFHSPVEVPVEDYPKYYCHLWNQNKQCRQNCKHSHTCFNCGGLHTFFNCKEPVKSHFRDLPKRNSTTRGRGRGNRGHRGRGRGGHSNFY